MSEVSSVSSPDNHTSGWEGQEYSWHPAADLSEPVFGSLPAETFIPPAEYPGSAKRPWNEIPLGINMDTGKEYVWDIHHTPHGLFYMPHGTGKTAVQGLLINHCIQHSDRWEVYGIDCEYTDVVDLTAYLPYETTVKGVMTNPEDSATLLLKSAQETRERLKVMLELGVEDFKDLVDPPKARLIMIDNLSRLITDGGEIRMGEPKTARSEATQALATLLRFGNVAGIYIVITNHDYHLEGEVPQYMKDRMSFRFANGKISEIDHQEVFGAQVKTRAGLRQSLVVEKSGIGLTKNNVSHIKTYFAKPDWATNWLAENSPTPTR